MKRPRQLPPHWTDEAPGGGVCWQDWASLVLLIAAGLIYAVAAGMIL